MLPSALMESTVHGLFVYLNLIIAINWIYYFLGRAGCRRNVETAKMAVSVALSAGNHVNVRAGTQRQMENRAAEQLKQIPEFSVTSECNRRDAKGAKDEGRLGTNGLGSQRKNEQGEEGLEVTQIEEDNFGECG